MPVQPRLAATLQASAYLAVPLPRTGSACSHLVSSSPKLKLQTMVEKHQQKNAPSLPTSKRRDKQTDEERQCKNKDLDRAREKTRTNVGASFQRLRELQDLRLKSKAELDAFLLDKLDPCLIYGYCMF